MRWLCLVLAALAGLAVMAGDLEVARRALGDGLWSVARAQAEGDSSDEALEIVLESLAAEDDWENVRKMLAAHPQSTSPALDYYRAVAAGNFTEATQLLSISSNAVNGANARVMEAQRLSKQGDAAQAETLWHQVLETPQAGAWARATAAAHLGDTNALRAVDVETLNPKLKTFVRLELGRTFLQSTNAAEQVEGESLIRKVVRANPDADGAAEAFVALAEVELRGTNQVAAAADFHRAIETWPAEAHSMRTQEHYGWALAALGRSAEALEALHRADGYATEAEDKARIECKIGQILEETGRRTEALDLYQTVVSNYPTASVSERLKEILRVHALEVKGRADYQAFHYAEAQSAFEAVGAADAERKPLMDYFCVLCLYGRGFGDSATQKAMGLLETCTNGTVRADTTLWLAKDAFNRTKWREAADLFASYVLQSPDSPEAPMALLGEARAKLADKDAASAIRLVTELCRAYPKSAVVSSALMVQAEALFESSRFDETLLVLDKVGSLEQATPKEKDEVLRLKADTLSTLGADNPVRFEKALEIYRSLLLSPNADESERLLLAYKIGRILEKLRRTDEAIDQYFTHVILAYESGRHREETYREEAQTAFVRAIFRVTDIYEAREAYPQAKNVLRYLLESGLPAAAEARKRMERIDRERRIL